MNDIKMPAVMPEYSPAYSVEFFCPEAHTVSVTVEADESAVREFLSFTPFEYVTSLYQIWVADLKGHTVAESVEGYKECGITIPVCYKGVTAGHSLFMYCSDVSAILAGREIFGLPKKYADIEFIETAIGVSSFVRRKGTEFVKVGFSFLTSVEDQPKEVVEVQKMNRLRIMLKVIPKADEEGASLRQIVLRDVARDIKEFKPGKADVTLRELDSDPIHKLGIKRVLGAAYTVSSYGGGWKSETRKILDNL